MQLLGAKTCTSNCNMQIIVQQLDYLDDDPSAKKTDNQAHKPGNGNAGNIAISTMITEQMLLTPLASHGLPVASCIRRRTCP